MYSTVFCVWQWYIPLEGAFLRLHLLVLQCGSEDGVVDSIPVAQVKVLVGGLVELALGKPLGILGQFLVVKIFGEIDRALLG